MTMLSCLPGIVAGDYNERKNFEWRKSLMPADRIRASYPDITEKDLEQLLKYLEAAERYCEDVSTCFSRYYGSPSVPESEKAQQDALRVVEACKKKYTWLQDEQVRYILESVCWQSSR